MMLKEIERLNLLKKALCIGVSTRVVSKFDVECLDSTDDNLNLHALYDSAQYNLIEYGMLKWYKPISGKSITDVEARMKQYNAQAVAVLMNAYSYSRQLQKWYTKDDMFSLLDRTNKLKDINCIVAAMKCKGFSKVVNDESAVWIADKLTLTGTDCSIGTLKICYHNKDSKYAVEWLAARGLLSSICDCEYLINEPLALIDDVKLLMSNYRYTTVKTVTMYLLKYGNHKMVKDFVSKYDGRQINRFSDFLEMLTGIKLNLNSNFNDLISYAYCNKKFTFIKLLGGIPLAVDKSSALLDKCLIKTVNLNTFNERTLKNVASLHNISGSVIDTVFDNLTPEEFSILYTYSASSDVMNFYKTIRDKFGIDESLVRFKEIETFIVDVEWSNGFTELITKHRFSWWLHDWKTGVHGLTKQNMIKILSNYEYFNKYKSSVRSNSEIDFLSKTIDDGYDEYDDKINNYVNSLSDSELFGKLTASKEQIYQYTKDGRLQIAIDYLNNCKGKLNELAIIVNADMAGDLQKVKYDQFNKEVGFCVDNKEIWIKQLVVNNHDCYLADYDDFVSAMTVGIITGSTCLNYSKGAYADCLLANFDANKKIVLVKDKQGSVLARAILRLTKALKNSAGVKFRDVCNLEEDSDDLFEPIVFLEKVYTKTGTKAYNGKLREFCKLKAAELGYKAYCSSLYKDEGDKVKHRNVYVSQSKNGAQYLDSLGGAKSRVDSGRFVRADVIELV